MAERRRSNLRIAFVAGSLGRGGAEKQLLAMCLSLAQCGADVRVYAFTSGEDYESRLRDAGIPVRYAGANPGKRVAVLLSDAAAFRPHVVQSGHSFANVYAGLTARLTGAIGVGAMRGSLRGCRDANGRFIRLQLKAPAAVVTNSTRTMQEVVDSGLLVPDRIHVVPNAIDPAVFRERSRRTSSGFRVAFVGRLIASKRSDVFLRTIACARSKNRRVEGVVMGDGPERRNMEELANDLGIAEAVTFAGECQDVPARLAAVDALVFCSDDDEGFPNVVLEAMAAGLPVISTPAGDVRAVVRDGRTGFLAGFGDWREMSSRVTALAADDGLCAEMGSAGQAAVEQSYSIRLLPERLFSVYRKIAEYRGSMRLLHALG